MRRLKICRAMRPAFLLSTAVGVATARLLLELVGLWTDVYRSGGWISKVWNVTVM